MPTDREQAFVNGKVFTARVKGEFAGAFLVAGEKFTRVGHRGEIRPTQKRSRSGRHQE